MRIPNALILRQMEKNLPRWLYPALDLADPLRATGITCYAANLSDPLKDLAMISDLDDATTVWAYTHNQGVIAEALADPAVTDGTIVHFCAGMPEDWLNADKFLCGEKILCRDTRTRTLDRYGLYSIRTGSQNFAPSPDFAVRSMTRDDLPFLTALDSSEWSGMPSLLPDFADGDGMLLAFAPDGRLAGYLWYTKAGARFYDIVNLFVHPGFRRRGVGKSLVLRYCTDARIHGRLAYYGYAASRESAMLAESLGFERLYPAPDIFVVDP